MTVENKEIGDSQAEVKAEANKNTEELLGSVLIDKRREDVEKLAIEENEKHSTAVLDNLLDDDKILAEDKKSQGEDKKDNHEEAEDSKEEADPIKRVMSKVQKRIDKEVAKRKTIEEELAETRAELDKIRNMQEAQVIGNKDDKSVKDDEPTLEQIASYLKKVRDEGNVVEEVRVLDYLADRKAKAERKVAMEELSSRDKKVKEAQEKQLADWNNLLNDYVVRDDSGKVVKNDPMNLANENGILYKTAMSLYHDPELRAKFYSDSDRVMGFRRATADAFREIYQNGLHLNKIETVEETPKNKRKMVLVEPTESGEEELKETSPSRVSDQDKVIEELTARRKFQISRNPFRQ